TNCNMTHKPLRTYLRTFRRRTCLSQDEVAFLLGSMCGTSVSRHERGTRIPLLETVLGYAFILGAEVPALYKGVSRDVQLVVRNRARGLCRNLERQPQGARRDRKIAVLKELLAESNRESDANEQR
ncbi:MAG: helix-turn-helix transcriptional regulator, partial [Longimicrobiales bacterium]